MQQQQKHTTQDLTSYLKVLTKANEDKIDLKNVKYKIYARKSSESEEKQVRSLGDQITECKEMAKSRNLNLYSEQPIRESESAKEPDIRPEFRNMIEEIKTGKYGGIIAWHPDRLARNMKDAGEIIDLIDKKIIKDLQFVTFTFQNNTAGKMLLGIAFVLSKQYSDQLSDNILRGIRRAIEEGKYLNKPKHGYYKDINQYLRPDGDNFKLIKEAWKMRLEGKRLEDIATYLNENRYSRPADNVGKQHKPYVIDKKRISLIMRDSIYCGVLLYGEKEKKVVDLTQVYEFIPMVSVDEFLAVNKIVSIDKFFKQRLKVSKEGDIVADLLRGKVLCGFCNYPMVSAITHKINDRKGLTNYYNYRCDNDFCKSKVKAVRANVVVNYCLEFLKKHKFTSRKAYSHYVAEMKRIIADKEDLLEAEHRSLIKFKSDTLKKIDKIKDLILEETDIQVKNTFKQELKDKQETLKEVEGKLIKLNEEREKHRGAILSYQEFLELFDELPEIIAQTKSLKEKDYLLGKIILNCVVKNKKVTNVRLNPPFDGFIKVPIFSTGGDGGN